MGILSDIGHFIENPISTTIGAVGSFLGDPGRWSPPSKGTGIMKSRTDTLAGVRAGPIGITLTNTPSTYSGGSMQAAPRGYHVITNPKSKNYGKLTKNRCMNIGNGRALGRALRRVKRFEKLARKVIKVTPHFRHRPHTGFGARRRAK